MTKAMADEEVTNVTKLCDAAVPEITRCKLSRKFRIAAAVLVMCVALPVTSVTAAAKDGEKPVPTTPTDNPAETPGPRHDATEHVRWQETYVTNSTLLSNGQLGTWRGKWRYYGNWDDPAAQPYVSSPRDSRVVPVKPRYYNGHWIRHWPENRWERLENGLDTKQWVQLTGWVIHADWGGNSWGGNPGYEYGYGQRTRSGTLREIHGHWYDRLWTAVCGVTSLAAAVVSVVTTAATGGLSAPAAFLVLSAGLSCFKAAVEAFFRDEPLGGVYVKGESTWLVQTEGATETVLVQVPVTRTILSVTGMPYT